MTAHLKLDEAPWSPLGEYEKIENAAHNESSGEHDGEEPWLLSYADMVTLLMCFFILFFSSDKGNVAMKDPARLLEQMRALEKLLGVENDLLPESDKFEYAKTSYDMQNLSASIGKDMSLVGAKDVLLQSIGVPRPGVLEISFQQDLFFTSGTANLTPTAKAAIRKVTARLNKALPGSLIEVEGHTDSSKAKKGAAFSNWDLSGQRAASVVEFLEADGFPARKLFFRGYGEQRPLMPEFDGSGKRIEKNMAVNRRVVIRVVDEASQ